MLLRSGTADYDNRKPRGEPDEEHRPERSCTPATVAEPDSTMSNDAGDQMSTDVEPSQSHVMVDVRDAKDGPEAVRQCVLDAAASEVVSSNVDATWHGLRQEGSTGSDTVRRRNQRGDTMNYVEQELAKSSQNNADSRLSGHTSRKRQYVDTEVNVQAASSEETADHRPRDGMRTKHRPDPLVLPTSSLEHYGYSSWLRSPRVWNGSGPIPYTPPPMLSPSRRAPGLFWAAARSQSQPLWSWFRQTSAFTCKCSVITLTSSQVK